MDKTFFAPLRARLYTHKPRAHHDFTKALEQRGPDDEIGNARLIFNCHEHNAICAARLLPDEYNARRAYASSINKITNCGAGQSAFAFIKIT